LYTFDLHALLTVNYTHTHTHVPHKHKNTARQPSTSKCNAQLNLKSALCTSRGRWQHKKALAIEKTRMRVIAFNRASHREKSHESCNFS